MTTLPFAFMYIPAEAIYYDLLVNEVGSVKVNTRNLIDYAYNDKKVIIVSPTTFMAYLQSILFGFKAFKIEKSAKEIIKKVEDLGKHLKSYDEYHSKLGNAIGTVVNHYNTSSKELKKIDKSGRLPAGILFTGSGAKIRGLVELAKDVLYLPAGLGYPIDIQSSTDRAVDVSFSTAVGLVHWGAQTMPGARTHGAKSSLVTQTGKWYVGLKNLFRSLMP
jgi:hypothetical protein